MSRGKPREQSQFTCTIAMDPELNQAVNNTMVMFGIENKAQTILMMVRAWLSANPEQAAVYQTTQNAIREVRKFEFEQLATYFAERAKAYKMGPG